MLYDLVCNLFPIMASFLSPSIHSRLSNEHYKIYVCEVYLTKNLTKSPTQPKWPMATVSADEHMYLTKGTQNIRELNDQLPGLESTFLTMRPRPHEHFWQPCHTADSDHVQSQSRPPFHPPYSHYSLPLSSGPVFLSHSGLLTLQTPVRL